MTGTCSSLDRTEAPDELVELGAASEQTRGYTVGPYPEASLFPLRLT